MDKEQELQILDQIRGLIRKQRVQRDFLLIDGQRINDVYVKKELFTSAFVSTMIERLETLEELQSEMMELIIEHYPDLDHHNSLRLIKEFAKERIKELTKRDKFKQTLIDINNIVFDSPEQNFNFREETRELRELNIDGMSDEECESIFGKYMLLFEAFRENNESKQAEWIIRLNGLFGMKVLSNIFSKRFKLPDPVINTEDGKEEESEAEEPVEPEEPIGSEKPVGAEAPAGPEKPAGSEAPSELAASSEPVVSTEPEEPADPEKPAGSEVSVELAMSSESVVSTESEEPAEPEKPAEAEAPVEPAVPVEPVVSTESEKPVEPEITGGVSEGPLTVSPAGDGDGKTNAMVAALLKALGLDASPAAASQNEKTKETSGAKKGQKSVSKQEAPDTGIKNKKISPEETQQDNTERVEKISEHARRLSEKLAGLDPESFRTPALLRKEISKKATQPFNLKTFKTDMSGDTFTLKKAVLNMAFDYDAVTWQLITYKENYNPKAVLPEAENLWRKGYLAKMEFEGIGRCYTLSDKGRSITGSKDSAKMLGKEKANVAAVSDSKYIRRTVNGLYLSSALQCMADHGEYYDFDNKAVICDTYLVVMSQRMSDAAIGGCQILNIGLFDKTDVVQLAKEIDDRIKSFGANLELIRVLGTDPEACRRLADMIREEYGSIAAFEPTDLTAYCAKVASEESQIESSLNILFNDEIEERKRAEEEKTWSELGGEPGTESGMAGSEMGRDSADDGEPLSAEAPAEKLPVPEVEVVIIEEEPVEPEEPDNEEAKDDDDFEMPVPEVYVFKNPESIGRFMPLSEEEVEQVYTNYTNMLANDLTYCAMAYIRAASRRSDLFAEDCRKLAYAVNDPAENCQYDSDRIFHIYLGSGESVLDKYLYLSAAIRTLFTSDNGYDYSIKQLLDNIRTIETVSNSNSLSNFLYELYSFKDRFHCGIDKYADYRGAENLYREERIQKLRERAGSLFMAHIIEQRSGNANQRRLEYTKRYIFAKDGKISELLKAVINNSTELLELVSDYMSEGFIANGQEIKKENISSEKIEMLIEEGWSDAAQYITAVRHTSKLMGSLRQNLYQRIYEVVAVISEWVFLSKENSQTSGEGNSAYRKLKPQLVSDIESFIVESEQKMDGDPSFTKSHYAGWVVLRDTLLEMQNRIEGRYSEADHKYYYVRFLKNNKVLLDQDYLPEFEIEVPEIEEMSMLRRIEAHANDPEIPLRDQLRSWCDDNFGTVRNIISYLEDVNKEKVENEAYLEEAIQYAAKATANKRLEFIENLELSQSYGQIDSTSEDRKDRILKIIDDWYAWSENTGNYGFYKCILTGFQNKIREDAKSREAEIRSELDITMKRGRTLNLDSEEMKAYIKRIREAIEAQNYTYAEDMILRLGAGDTGVGYDLLEEDYLRLFWKEFEQNYYATAGASKSLEYKYERFQRENRDTKAARSLISLWLPNGGHMGEERIQRLMYMLGFPVESAAEKDRIADKIENYEITLKKNANGKKANYKHPIAAFGSGAMQEGFRIVCLYGTYDADRLIEMYREIGDAMNTIVLLDCALNRDQRQRLARKIKKEASNATFGLIDRVAFMFLVNNYKDATISKMLMSVMMPFSYYQPYVYDSSSPIPPEMFIGRKTELNKIEDPNGANIVYGGRQLGKSALLLMAKAEIDRNENGDRAVFVDVKGKDEKKSCLKVSQALVDDGILEEGSETEDWSELSRSIRRRLAQEENRIPYLLLLIDEADAFLESSEKNEYAAFDNLLEIQNIGQKRFKFVIAGLRNVVRFNRDAINANKSMTKFGALSISPLAYAEARELLEVPLNCLGLRFPKEKEALVSMIFASANYFPGLIQLYCAKLIEAMTKDDYAGYDQDRTPPYEVMEKHIKKVLADTGFQQQIREKFMITLKIDADDYYYVIALLMAYLYNSFYNEEGYTPEDIWETAMEFGFRKIVRLDVEKVRALMVEMCELNVFHELTEDHFKFSRYNFYQMMGDKSRVEEEILSYLER